MLQILIQSVVDVINTPLVNALEEPAKFKANERPCKSLEGVVSYIAILILIERSCLPFSHMFGEIVYSRRFHAFR